MSDSRSPGLAYAVTLIADTHFDEEPWSRYRDVGMASADPKTLADHRRNIEMWRSRLPSLLDAAAAVAKRENAAFVQHLGDIAHGTAANGEALTRMLSAGRRLIAERFGEIPFRFITGNHDLLAPGGLAAYRAWSGSPADGVFRTGPDAWIFIDSENPPGVERLRELFREARGARWTFFLSHRPLFPFSGTASFRFLYSTDPECRQELVRLAAESRAIILSSHIHTVIHSVFDFPEGRVVQFTANSLWSRDELERVVFKPSSRRDWCRKLSSVPPERRAALAALANEFRPYLELHRRAHCAGHFLLRADDDSVRVEIRGGSGLDPDETVILARQKSERTTNARILRNIADLLRRALRIPRKSTSR